MCVCVCVRVCVCVCVCECTPLCLLSDVAAVFQSACVIMRPQGAENSDSLTWRGEERSEAEGDPVLLFHHRAREPDTCENLPSALTLPQHVLLFMYIFKMSLI